jgi:parallel beta-helix repeat protein
MNGILHRREYPIWASLLLGCTAAALAGDLNPPAGPIAPTMKPLSQIEPRIAVSATNTPGDANSLYRITQPGSYYLTGSITGVPGKNGIAVLVSDVSLDLMGFEVIGVAGSLNGVGVPNPQPPGTIVNLSIRNGIVRGWGGTGANADTHAIVDGIRASNNGGPGIAASYSVIRNCVAQSNSTGIAAGIGSAVTDCTASQNTTHGINAISGTVIQNCSASFNQFAGISTSINCSINTCTVQGNTTYGIQTGLASKITGCAANANGVHGIVVPGDCVIADNMCHGNGTGATPGSGVFASGGGNRIESNTVNNNDQGIEVPTAGNLVIRNAARNNSLASYSVSAGNTTGPVVTSANIATNSNPHANYSY